MWVSHSWERNGFYREPTMHSLEKVEAVCACSACELLAQYRQQNNFLLHLHHLYPICTPRFTLHQGSLCLTLYPGGRLSVGCCMASCYQTLSFPSEISAGCGRTDGGVSSHALPCLCVIFLIGTGILDHGGFCPFSQPVFMAPAK